MARAVEQAVWRAARGRTQMHPHNAKSSKSLFSGKQKKKLLKDERFRRDQKRSAAEREDERERVIRSTVPWEGYHVNSNDVYAGKLATKLALDSRASVLQRHHSAQVPYEQVEVGQRGFPYYDQGNIVPIEIPIRPHWNEKNSKEDLDNQEQLYFSHYVEDIKESFGGRMNKFELNLEVWRQLWRVIERSDIILILLDCRFPIVNFPVGLWHYLQRIQMPCAIVFTKTDLIPECLLEEWKHWFHEKYPGLSIVSMSSHHSQSTSNESEHTAVHIAAGSETLQKHELTKKMTLTRPEGENALLDAVKALLPKNNEADNTSHVSFQPSHITGSEFEQDSQLAAQFPSDNDGEVDSDNNNQLNAVGERQQSDRVLKHSDKERALILPQRRGVQSEFATIGVLGYPNAGKSSLINALAGRRVVSVSRTPGHTKHLQTIFLNKYTRLCDCPGLVFPNADIPYHMQVLAGHINIAQVRETYSTLAYVGARSNFVHIYDLHLMASNMDHNDHVTSELAANKSKSIVGETELKWSGYSIAEAWAMKRGFLSSSLKTLDTHRAGNELLRFLQQGTGKMIFAIAPPLRDETLQDAADNNIYVPKTNMTDL